MVMVYTIVILSCIHRKFLLIAVGGACWWEMASRTAALLVTLAAVSAYTPTPRRSAPRPSAPRVEGRPASELRRACLSLPAVLPVLLAGDAARALDLPFVGKVVGGADVQLLEAPPVCQGRCRDQDFVMVKYTGRIVGGDAFDERYASRALTYELGSFYLPGVDAALDGTCVGSRLRFTWAASPSLGAEFDSILRPGTPIELELQLVGIKYSLFGEKMRDPSSTYWFNPTPLTLTSAADERGHGSPRTPVVNKDNPFSIAPGEKNIISNPSSMLGPLFKDFF